MAKHSNTEGFISKAKKIHGNKYDYSFVVYKSSKEKVNIFCYEIGHGIFPQTPSDHISGYGCPKCSGNIRSDTNSFIKKAIEVHGNKYDYSFVIYKNNREKVSIFCKEINHGIFEQTPSNHLQGQGCPKCGGTHPLDNNLFIEMAIKVHGNKYDYSLVNYISMQTKVKIICPTTNHGIFYQTPGNHLRGQNCPKCVKNRPLTTDIFIERSKNIHENKYNYSKTVFKNKNTKIIIICPNHGEFKQLPYDHLYGAGCQKCSSGNNISKTEIAWLNYINIPDDEWHRQVKLPGLGNKKSVDGFDPDTNTVYEFHGDYFHGNLKKFSANDLNKTIKKTFGQLYQETIEKENLIRSLGYNLVVMWESDWKKISK